MRQRFTCLCAAYGKVEMMDVFSFTQPFIERNRGRIVSIGLHVDHVCSAFRGDAPELGDQTVATPFRRWSVATARS